MNGDGAADGLGDASSQADAVSDRSPATDGGADSPTGARGAIFVSVSDSSGRPAADVVISTDPATRTVTTDALGSVLLGDVAPGIYGITGVHPTQGSARSAVVVAAGQIANVDLVLRKSTAMGAPTVIIVAPANGATVIAGATVTLRGSVSDDLDPPPSLRIEWRSSLDGILGVSAPSITGEVAQSAFLSAGMHTITLKVTDSSGLSATSTITLNVGFSQPSDGGSTDVSTDRPANDGSVDGSPDGASDAAPSTVVTLAAPTKDSNGINLSWTTTPATGVTSYRIYRAASNGSFEVIDLLSDPATVTYRDVKTKLGVTYSYRVGAIFGPGQEVASNVQMVAAGVYIPLDTQVTAMLVDKKRPYLYAIDSVNNSLLFVNLTTNKLEKTIFIGSKPADLDINQDGSELYIANFGATEIAVVNLETREKARALTVNTTAGTWDGNPYRLACTAGGTVVFTSMDQWNDLKLVDGTTGASLGGATGSIYQPELVASPDGTHVYVGESGISTVTLQRFDVAGNKLQQADTSGDAGSYGGRSLAISGDGTYLFFAGKKFLAKNLKSVLGTFSEPIYLANSDGSVAIGASNVFNGNTFAVLRATPLSTSVMALSADDATLYLYDTMTSRLYLYALK